MVEEPHMQKVCVCDEGGWNGQLLSGNYMETISNMQQLSEGDPILQPVIVMYSVTL